MVESPLHKKRHFCQQNGNKREQRLDEETRKESKDWPISGEESEREKEGRTAGSSNSGTYLHTAS